MRRWLVVLGCLLAVGLGGSAQAAEFIYTRWVAPATDLTPYSPIIVLAFENDSYGWISGREVATQLSSALQAEGQIRVLSPGVNFGYSATQFDTIAEQLIATGAQAMVIGSVRADSDVSYGYTTVRKEYTVWREVRDSDTGRVRRVEEREWRDVHVRTENRSVSVTLEATAIDLTTGDLLGTESVTESNSAYWQEDSSYYVRSGQSLARDCLDAAVLRLARRFTPWREEVKRGFRPERGRSETVKAGVAAAEAGDFVGAIALFREEMSNNPKDTANQLGNIVIVQEAAQDYPGAMATLTEALALPPGGHDLPYYKEGLAEAYGLRPMVPRNLGNARSLAPSQPQPAPSPEETGPAGPRIPRIVRITGDKLFIDAGAVDGWVADTVMALAVVEEVIGQDGELLGHYDTPVGTIQLTEVFERFAVGELLSLEAEAEVRVGLAVRPVELAAPEPAGVF